MNTNTQLPVGWVPLPAYITVADDPAVALVPPVGYRVVEWRFINLDPTELVSCVMAGDVGHSSVVIAGSEPTRVRLSKASKPYLYADNAVPVMAQPFGVVEGEPELLII